MPEPRHPPPDFVPPPPLGNPAVTSLHTAIRTPGLPIHPSLRPALHTPEQEEDVTWSPALDVHGQTLQPSTARKRIRDTNRLDAARRCDLPAGETIDDAPALFMSAWQTSEWSPLVPP